MTLKSIGEVRDVPSFGGYDDPDVRRAYEWFQQFLEQADWIDRVAAIEAAIEEVIEPRPSRGEAQDHKPLSIDADRMGWYLYLVHTALDDPLKYEPIQGSRVLPIFKRLGADLDLVTTIGGVEDRIARMFGSERDQPDAALFELLIALLWRRNGYDPVEFIPERSDSKTPDFKARRENDECAYSGEVEH